MTDEQYITHLENTRTQAVLLAGKRKRIIDDLLEALEAVEWGSDGAQWCSSCFNHEWDGHGANCQLNQAIKKARGEK
jgi:hypothetical protein